MRLSSLHIYPVKGMRAVDVARAHVGTIGLDGDRRWMMVDADNRFITQRTHTLLATITAVWIDGGVRLSADGAGAIDVAIPSGNERATVAIWDSIVDAAVADARAHAWLSAYFGEPLRLVHMDARAGRDKTGIWVPRPVPVSFADAYPVLVATTGALNALNRALQHRGQPAVPMRRFRPNVVIDCDEPWADDYWAALRIGDVVLDLVKPSDRCIVTTTDQATGARTGNEPLATLARVRLSADPRINGVLFAWNAVPGATGDIRVGDEVDILERRASGFPLRQSG
jgi:hypothetical protein